MKKGFTLVELITVIIIIAILAALALPQYTRVVERGQATKAKGALDVIRKAQSIYFSLYSEYATALNTSLTVEVPEVASANLNDADWNYGLTHSNTTTFTATARRMRGAFGTPPTERLRLFNNGKLTTMNKYPYGI